MKLTLSSKQQTLQITCYTCKTWTLKCFLFKINALKGLFNDNYQVVKWYQHIAYDFPLCRWTFFLI
jgi:hypothetical protein